MRVVIVSQHYPPERSGNATRIANMAENLAKQGTEVTVVSPHPTFPYGVFRRRWLRKTEHYQGAVHIVNLWAWQPARENPGFMPRIAYYLLFPLHACLWVLLNRNRFEVIISTAPPIFTAIPGLLAKSILQKRLVYDVRDLWIDASISLGFVKKGTNFERVSRALEQMTLKKSNIICSTTELLAVRLRTHYKLDGQRILIISNGVNVDRYRLPHVQKKRQIAYVGNVGHAQDLESVILAMKIIQHDHPEMRLVIAGDGDICMHLQEVAREAGVENLVDFRGVMLREDIPILISESIAGVAPVRKLESLEYMAPIKVYEYMAYGIPFVGCGMGEIVRLARTSGGGIIAENTPEGIAKALAYLIENPDVTDRMGRSGMKYVLDHHSWFDISSRLRAALKELSA